MCLAWRCFGTKLVSRRHVTRTSEPPPPLLFAGDQTERTTTEQVTLEQVEVPAISADVLARMPVGAARAKLADGSLHKF